MQTRYFLALFLAFFISGCAADTKYRAQQIVAELDKSPARQDARRTRTETTQAQAPVQTPVVVVAKPLYTPQDGSRALKKISYDNSIVTSPTGGQYALLIGINEYKNFTRLETAVHDIEIIEKVLRENFGFQTITIRNQEATRDNIVEAINTLRRKLSPNDKLLIYYAGHGHFDKATDTSYWIPYEADTDSDTHYIEAKSVITTNLKRISAKQILVIADSCYSGTLSRSTDINLQTNQLNRDAYIKNLSARTSRVLIASGGNEPVADGGGGGHSIFAKAFINGLLNHKESVFSSEELFINTIRESVGGQASQLPEYKIIRDSGHEGGDFIFKRKTLTKTR
jgi:Caspase domain